MLYYTGTSLRIFLCLTWFLVQLLGQSNNVAFVGNTSNVTTPCSTNTPAYFNLSDPNLDRTKYGLAIYPTSPSNDPNGVGLGMGYANTPLGVSIYICIYTWACCTYLFLFRMLNGLNILHSLQIKKHWLILSIKTSPQTTTPSATALSTTLLTSATLHSWIMTHLLPNSILCKINTFRISLAMLEPN